MAAAFHRFWCWQCILLPLFLGSSFLMVIFSSPACLPAEPTTVFGVQLNDNTFFWEFWSESKLDSWVLSPKSTWFHRTIFYYLFDCIFIFFLRLLGIWGCSLGNASKAFFVVLFNSFPLLSFPIFQLANILNPGWMLKAGMMIVFMWFLKHGIISEITFSGSLLLCAKCCASTNVCKDVSV